MAGRDDGMQPTPPAHEIVAFLIDYSVRRAG